MEWASEWQLDMLEDEAADALAFGAAMHDLGVWQDGTAIRYRLQNGQAAWLKLTKGNMLQCIAVAPWDDWIKEGSVEAAALFNGSLGSWPDTWRTKRMALQQRLAADAPMMAGKLAVGLREDSRCWLVDVVEIGADGKPSVVLTVENGPEIDARTLEGPIKRWWRLADKHEIGGRKLLAQGKPVLVHNYRLLCIQCAMAELPLKERLRLKREAAKAAADAKQSESDKH